MSLNGDPRFPVPDETRLDLIRRLWQRKTVSRLDPRDLHWEPYFDYYTTECNLAIESGQGEFASVRTHADIISLSELLGSHHTKSDIIQKLRPTLTRPRPAEVENVMLEGSIGLVARLVAMVDVGPRPYASEGQPSLSWSDSSLCLRDVIAKRFQGHPSPSRENVDFEEDFTAYNLKRLAGMDIVWTDDLADHLRLTRDRKRLRIFHHASFLKWQDSDILPAGLAQETLRTLGLLFPPHDRYTRKWIASISSPLEDSTCVDRHLVDCERLRECRADDFVYWRKELLALKDVFDDPKQRSIFQQWHDKRNTTQWYTFWIAIVVLCLTVFFGLIQSVEGAIQVYKAYHPTH